MSSVRDFQSMVEALADGRQADASSLFQKVLAQEKEADDVHRDLSTRIAEGAFFGGVREDMLNLLEKIDNIADSAKDAARFLGAEERLDQTAIALLRSDPMKSFVSHQLAAVGALQELVAALDLGKKEALARIHRVEEFEEAADADKDGLMKGLFAQTTANPVTIIQMRDFLFRTDDIADNAEDASDVVLILVAKGYG